MNGYWDERFRAEGRIWGDAPSATARLAVEIFRAHDVHSVLVPGSGYGRHTDFFARAGFKVTGIEISKEALALVRPNPGVTYHLGSCLDFPLEAASFDAVYCFNVLHLFPAQERACFVKNVHFALKEEGVAFFAVFSEEEPQFGKGRQIEENTFESKPGRPVHFFTDEDLRETFCTFAAVATGLMDDPEEHGAGGPHTHRIRWIAARKRPAYEFDSEKSRSASKHQKEWERR